MAHVEALKGSDDWRKEHGERDDRVGGEHNAVWDGRGHGQRLGPRQGAS